MTDFRPTVIADLPELDTSEAGIAEANLVAVKGQSSFKLAVSWLFGQLSILRDQADTARLASAASAAASAASTTAANAAAAAAAAFAAASVAPVVTRVTIDNGITSRGVWRDDGAGNFSGYVGATGATDGSMVEFMEVDKTTGEARFPAFAHFGGALVPNKAAASAGAQGGFTVWSATTAYMQWYNSGAGTNQKWWRAGLNTAGTLVFETVNDGYTAVVQSPLALTAAGNVGVGTGSPLAKLHTATGDSALSFLSSGLTKGVRIIHDSTQSKSEGGDSTGTASYQPIVLVGSTVALANSTGGVLHMTNTSLVGINTTGPAETLDVNGIVRCRSNVKIADAGYFYTPFNGATDTGSVRAGFQFDGVNQQVNFYTSNTFRGAMMSTGTFQPGADNTQNLGAAGARWATVFAGTGTINTSDQSEKTALRKLSKKELAAARELAGSIGVYQWLASVAEKGEDGARLHVGLIAQDVEKIMAKHGLDGWRYGFLCRDAITKRVKQTRTRMVPKTEIVEESYTEIEIVAGVPTQVVKTHEVRRTVGHMMQVHDHEGQPLFRERVEVVAPEQEGDEPTEVVVREPVLHLVPEMVEETYEVDLEEPAGDRLGLRYDQLYGFILAGIAT